MTSAIRPEASTSTLGWRFIMAGIGAATGLLFGSMIWLFNWLTGKHHEVLMTTLFLMLVQAGIGFFVSARRAAWMDSIVYFLLLGFLDSN